MPLQPPNYFGLVDPANPVGTDSRTISDDYHRMILASMQQQGPNWNGAIVATHADLDTLTGVVAAGANKAMVGTANTTVTYFYNSTVPPGWTLIQPDTNLRNLTIAGSGDTPGTISGNIDPSAATLGVSVVNVTVNLPANTGAHTLVIGEIPAHTHTWAENFSAQPANTSAGSIHSRDVGGTALSGRVTSITGGGGSHSHTIGGTAAQTGGSGAGSSATFNPRRAIGILGRLGGF